MPAGTSSRAAVAQQILDLLPQMRRYFERELPVELGDDMSGVTFHQIEALSRLIGCGGMTMNELATQQAIGLSSATALADRLLRQGLAQRTSDPGDRRVVRLLPTDSAVALVHRYQAAKKRIAARLLDTLDENESATLLRLFSKMLDAPQSSQEDARG